MLLDTPKNAEGLLRHGMITQPADPEFVLNADLCTSSHRLSTGSAILSATTMTTKSTNSKRPKTTRNKRPAGRGGERVRRIQLGCPEKPCRGVCTYVYVDDEAALKCSVCGMIYRMDGGLSRPWFFTG